MRDYVFWSVFSLIALFTGILCSVYLTNFAHHFSITASFVKSSPVLSHISIFTLVVIALFASVAINWRWLSSKF